MKYSEIYSKAISILKEQGRYELFQTSREVGIESGYVRQHNLEFFNNLSFEMRVIDTEVASTETEIFGQKLRTPIMSGAMSGLQEFTEDPIVKIARGIGKAGSMMWMGACPPEQVERVIKTDVPTVVVVKPYKDNKEIERRIVDAEQKGAVAVGIDVDFFAGGKRGDDERMVDVVGPKSTHELKNFKSITKLPFVLKGILSKRDADKAEKIGADAICISNHGGAVLDYAAHPLQLLPSIKKAVSDEMVILADSGFRRGTDVLKALALGAKGVLMGSCVVVGLIANAEDGVNDMVNAVTSELQRAMTLTGCIDVAHINKQILRRA